MIDYIAWINDRILISRSSPLNLSKIGNFYRGTLQLNSIRFIIYNFIFGGSLNKKIYNLNYNLVDKINSKLKNTKKVHIMETKIDEYIFHHKLEYWT